MRKSLAGLLLFTAVLFGITSAGNIAVDENSSKSSCNSSETEEKYLYLRPGYTVSDTPRDTFWNTVDSMIKRGETSVQLWRNGVITDCSDWNTSSIVVPSSDTAMVVINRDGCDFQTPSYTKVNNPSAVDAQIHYTIGYARVWESGTKTYNGKLYYKNHGDSNWTCYPGGSKVSDNQSCPNTTVNYVDETKYHEGECINYHVFRCGDGLVNKPMGDATRYDNVTYNEECDPASSDWKNRTDGKSCNASCKIEYEASSCGSLNGTTAYNSNYSSPRLSESSAGLCGVGKVVAGSFSYNKTTGKYTWSCKNGNATAIACNAQDLWCGDGKVQSSYEACDPKDSTQAGWKEGSWKTCSSSCKIEDIPRTGPSCSSTYNKKTEYTSTSAVWLSSSDKLCDVGSLVSGSFGYSGTPRTFTWKCINDGLDTTCNAYQQWCGDGKKNGNEVCDPQDTTNKSGWGDGCSTSCDKATYNKGVCGSTYHTKKTYMSIDTDRLTQYTQGLCDKGTVTNFKKHTSSHIYTWQCDNHGNISDTCWADQEWCGDGIKNGTETCDDGSKNGTSISSCSATCTAVSSVSCGTQNGGTKYFSSKQTSPWLTRTSNGMCAAGLTVGTPEIKGTDSHLEWTCSNANGSSTTCKAYQEWCGDGVKNGSETCDDGSKNGTSSSSCSATCTTVSGVSCGTQNGGTKYFSSKQTSPWLTKTSNGMCAAGLTVGTPEIKGTDSHLEWTCSNANGSSTTCKAYQEWCGDGVKNGSETCDEGSKNGTSSSSCSATCTAVSSVSCGTQNGGTKYFSSRQTTPWLTRTSNGMCSVGTVGTPEIKGTDSHLEWTCSNANGLSTTCKAYQEWCGDEILQSDYEECDYNDKNETNWGNDGCDTSCAQKNEVVSECDENNTFHRKLRQNSGYIFADRFNAGSADRRLYGNPSVKFDEKMDYNRGANPTFSWTTELVNNDMKVPQGKDMLIVESSPEYIVKDHPVKRTTDNLYVEYTVSYANKKYTTTPSSLQLKTHKECVYYEISRCGDGVLDEDYGEECDPGSEGTKVMPDGRICNADCKLVTVVTPLCNSEYNGQRVNKLDEGSYLCREGAITGFNYDTSTYKWTWKCHNVAGEVECRAIKPYCGDGILDEGEQCDYNDKNHTNWGNGTCNKSCQLEYPKGTAVIEKTLENKIPVDHEGQALTWIVKVTASGGDISNFEIWDKMPIELDYVDYNFDSAHSQSGVTVTYDKQRSPVRSGNVNIHYWNTTGTLHNGNSIVIKVNTTVNTMPRTGEDILNIACVIKDNKELDCGEDKPPRVKGTAVIEKTLENKIPVDHEGQALTWIVKVTASGGDISNFEIWDKMPIELDYVDYNFDSAHSQKGVTVTYDKQRSPVRSGNVNIHYWNTTGTLYNGNSIVIKVNTTVNTMPRTGEDILNIACVIKDNKELDCGEDKPPVTKGELIPEKLLTGSKVITKTGDAVVWKLIVTASGGDISGFVVRDVLPPVLGYSGYVPLESAGLEIKSPTTGTVVSGGQTLERIEWRVLGTLYEGKSMSIQLTTYAKVMPDRDYDNVLCVRPQDRPESDNKCDEAEVPAPKLWINKTFTDGTDKKEVRIGESIAYKIAFGNSGTATATITSIKDFLPKNVGYSDGAIFINRSNNYKTGTQEKAEELLKGFKVEEGVRIEIYGGMTLEPGDSGYIILTGKVLSVYTGNRQNFACIYLNDKKIDCDDAVHTISTGEVACMGNIAETASESKCYGNSWTTPTITCNSTGGIADKIELLCDNVVQVSGTNISHIEGACTFSSDGNHSVQCRVNGSTNGSKCEGTYTLSHRDCTPSSTCFIAGTKVTMADGSEKNIEDVKIGEKVLGSNGTINTVLGYDRPVLGDRHLWSINGLEYFVSEEHPFKTTDGWKSFNPERTKLEVNLNTTELKVGDILITAHGEEIIKTADYIEGDYNTQLYNFVLDGDHTYYANNYLVHNKNPKTDYCESHPEDAVCNFASPSCFNVNEGNISIETGEYLPFYLNIESNYSKDYEYKVYKGWSFDDFKNDEGCSPKTVALNSMVCTYIIRDVRNRIVFKERRNCLMDGNVDYDDKLIDAWIERQNETYDAKMQSLYDDSYTYKAGISFTKPSDWRVGTIEEYNNNGPKITEFGEYKFQIVQIEFYQCNKDGKWELAVSAGPVCQSNFVLTKPYTVQKTPSGNLTASTDTLNKFKEADGSEIKTFGDYVSNITPTTYNENAAVKTAMNNFITKYKKLAVEVNIDKSKFLNKNNSTVKVSKVPGKDIYFVDGSITIKGGTSNITKSFTIVQTNGSTTIDGNVNHNMMLLTNNNIIFSGRCTSNQTVKGIFYAGGSLIRNGVGKNDNLGNRVWCSKGGLYVKGVLIGSDFEKLMEKSRSHIEDWWDESNGVSRKTKVMNGASVVIEYSPSVFTKSTMPPGAEDFTTALSIYKQ